jgi:hypothetical protein
VTDKPEIVDFDLIHQWRHAGRSYKWIGRALAQVRGRALPFQAASIGTAYLRWLDATGTPAPLFRGDLRTERRRR